MALDTPALDSSTTATDLRDAADIPAPASPADTLVDAAPTPGVPVSPIKDREDLRRLNRRATQEGMYTGMAGGGVITYVAHRMKMPKNGLVLTFLLSSTTISFLITRTIIRNTLGQHYAALRAASEPAAPLGGGFMADDLAAGDAAAPKTGKLVEKELKPEERELSRVLTELQAVRTVSMPPRERTLWTKGRGLDGEVEEEGEMADTFLRPGVPRREV